ncbi:MULTISPECIES: hypothetical protein [Peribacillus]|uniref:hypothetical protein n=1 Tax=Peribacillus TaxID=2675229 RepID=UPI001F4EDEA7|nr:MULTISPECIES: hypothetical protein [unclassified Peribacillus]MCK1984220.1 hypothetical protein [Peribacillus sp. Aquil_B1]MCK2008390.1 hypothetical protein [Peribacillus sp. Aquil_B8]
MNQWLDISQRLNENTPYWLGDSNIHICRIHPNKGDCLGSKELPARNKLSGCGIHTHEGLVLES